MIDRRSFRRFCTFILVILLGGSATSIAQETAFSAPIPNKNQTQPPVGWRRTTAGWEPKSNWIMADLSPPDGPLFQTAVNVHPLTIAAFQVLASFGFLLAFDRSADEKKSSELAE